MEANKVKTFLKEDNYVHCSICGNYRNINSFSHRKSKDHQKRLAFKLRKISFHLSKKKKIPVVIHDEFWQEKETKHFCHFCSENYAEHHLEDEFIIEHLGSLYHHADSHHAECVKSFLKRNFSEEKPEKYCVQKSIIDSFLSKLPETKEKYLKKMDLLNHMSVKQIKLCEEERKKIIADTLQEQAYSFQGNNSLQSTESVVKPQPMLKIKNNKDGIKIPPWLEDVSDNSTGNQSSAPVIGPTLDTLVKHMLKEKNKGLPKKRVGANFKHGVLNSSKWLPSFQRTWSKTCRKQTQNQFKRRTQK